MAEPLVDYADVLIRCRIDDDDGSVPRIIEEATAVILKHIKAEDGEWPEDWGDGESPETFTVPADIQHATFLMISEMYHNREASVEDLFSENVMWLLDEYRDPTLA